MKYIRFWRTYSRLGLVNVLRVGAYKLLIKSRLHPVQRLRAPIATQPFYRLPEGHSEFRNPNASWDDSIWWFGRHRQPLPDMPPDWFTNPFTEGREPVSLRDWWTISDFDYGDIKGLWELSRFDWVIAWATKSANGDQAALERLNNWLDNWASRNAPYKGPNWKCGQEASIRVMHLITAAWILGQDREPEPGLVSLLRAHMQRIAATMSYAISQQNNHGTSEAAALFIGGIFLENYDPRAKSWAVTGRNLLEKLAQTLIQPDGSFSQYSVTYHRLMLDTYALAEAWRKYRGLDAFSNELLARLESATNWLWVLTDADTGDAPNIGGNDGARLIQLTDCDYRDFRPSVQLAASLFCGKNAFGSGNWNAQLQWLGVNEALSSRSISSITFSDGGFHVLRTDRALAVLRYPCFRFRPGHADALHLDLWHSGKNLLRDAGTFSYNAKGTEWFASTAAHNTVTFDGHDQMPRLGRFLFGDWLRSEAVEMVRIDDQIVTAAAAYTCKTGSKHHRHVTLTPNSLICIDTLSGPFKHAELRWRLCPGNWYLEGNTLIGDDASLKIQADEENELSLKTTFESRYYQQQSPIPVLAVEICKPAVIETRVVF